MLGRIRCRICGEAEAGDCHERERQEPDEEPVGERARHDSSTHLGVVVDDLERGVDRTVMHSLCLGTLHDVLGAGLQRGNALHQRSARAARRRPVTIVLGWRLCRRPSHLTAIVADRIIPGSMREPWSA